MKRILLHFFLVFCLLSYPIAHSEDGDQDLEFFLVTDYHGHADFGLRALTDVIYHNGRIKVVRLKNSLVQLLPSVQQHLRPIKMKDISVFVPQDRALAANPEIQELVNRVSVEGYKRTLEKLTSFQSRSSRELGRTENSSTWQATEWMRDQFEAAGLNAELQCYREHSNGKECNVVGTKRATEPSDEVILIEAHFDDVGHHQAGADDNASGAAALIAIAQALREVELQRNVVFLATNGEEVALNGSRAFVKSLESEQRLSQIKFVINMDMIGYNRGNRLMEIETNREFEPEALWYADRVRTYTNLTPEITIPAWGSDHVPFLEKGIPTVLTIEDWQTRTPCYHRSCDKFDTINFEYAIEIVKLNLAVVAEKAEIKSEEVERKWRGR